jgi:hypothetical protein
MGAQYVWDGRNFPIERRECQTIEWTKPIARTNEKGLTQCQAPFENN